MTSLVNISIIIPVGRPATAQKTINSILQQSFLPVTAEIIVVGFQLDGLRQVFKDERFRFVTLERPGNPAETRAAGVEAATGSLYLFIDDDIEIASTFIEKLLGYLSNSTRIGAVGARLPCRHTGYFARVTDYTNFWSQQSRSSGDRCWLYSAALAIPAEVYKKVGGFNVDLAVGEDVELTTRIKAAGFMVVYRAELQAHHNHGRTSFRAAAQYFWNNGKLAKFIFQKNKHIRAFSLNRVVIGIMSCLWQMIRYNRRDWHLLCYYFPGVVMMYGIFNFSLELQYQLQVKENVIAYREKQSLENEPELTGICQTMIERKYRLGGYGARIMSLLCSIKEASLLLGILGILFLIAYSLS